MYLVALSLPVGADYLVPAAQSSISDWIEILSSERYREDDYDGFVDGYSVCVVIYLTNL
jgi:hypothetical protein